MVSMPNSVLNNSDFAGTSQCPMVDLRLVTLPSKSTSSSSAALSGMRTAAGGSGSGSASTSPFALSAFSPPAGASDDPSAGGMVRRDSKCVLNIAH